MTVKHSTSYAQNCELPYIGRREHAGDRIRREQVCLIRVHIGQTYPRRSCYNLNNNGRYVDLYVAASTYSKTLKECSAVRALRQISYARSVW